MKMIHVVSVLLMLLAVTGCESKQAKLAALKAQYDPLNKQYYDECVDGAKGADAYFKGTHPKVPTPQEEAAHNQKCAQELKQVTALEQQMQALQK